MKIRGRVLGIGIAARRDEDAIIGFVERHRRRLGADPPHDVEHQHFPDYAVSIDNDLVKFRNRSAVLLDASSDDDEKPYLDAEVLNEAKAFAPGYDVYALYEEWASWWRDMEKPILKNPASAFFWFL